MRSPNVVNGLGLGFVGVIVLWLVVNFVKDPTYFLNIGLDGLTRGTVYGVVALGYTLVYGILQLINFAHGDVFALSGLVASTLMLSLLSITPSSSNAAVAGAVVVTLLVTIPLFAVVNGAIERVAYRPLRNAPRVAPLITAVGMSFIVSERVAGAIRGRLRERLRADPAGRRVPHSATSASRGSSSSQLAIIVPALAILTWFVESHPPGEGHACRSSGHGGLGNDGDQRQPDDLDHLRYRAARSRLWPGSCSSSSFRCVTTTGFELGLIAFTAAVLGGIGNLPGAVLGALF